MRRLRCLVASSWTFAAVALMSAPALAAPGDAASDSVYLVGEFVDPVCVYQHGMLGTRQRECAMVRGRVEQGIFFYDLRARELHTVIGQTHWVDPQAGFHASLGETVAVTGKQWTFGGSSAIAIDQVHPWRAQPIPVYRSWPWHWEWTVVAGCALLAAAYAVALARGRRRGERAEGWRIACFAASLVVVLVSLNGPLHDLSDRYLFSAHMIQHLFLAQLFPLLFVLGIPAWAWRALLRPRAVAAAWGTLARVPVGFVLYTLVFSIWHVPFLYDLMMRDHDFHVFMHLGVMATATLMWWPVVGGAAVERPLSPPAQLLYLFLLGTPMMAVAALIVFAHAPLYEWYALAPRFQGMTALEDQKLGGLIMWVPGGLFFWVIMSAVFFRWSARESRDTGGPVVIGGMPERSGVRS